MLNSNLDEHTVNQKQNDPVNNKSKMILATQACNWISHYGAALICPNFLLQPVKPLSITITGINMKKIIWSSAKLKRMQLITFII